MRVMKLLKLGLFGLLGLIGLLVLTVSVLALKPPVSRVSEIDFTRHVGTYFPGAADGPENTGRFFGVPGTGRIIVAAPGGPGVVTVELNGEQVVGPGDLGNTGSLETAVELDTDNTISVTVDPQSTAGVSVRVKQKAWIEMHVESRVHFNTNVSDFAEARVFYGKLGFQTLTGFPDTNTQEMAQAIGIDTPTSYDGSKGDHAGGYLLHGELIGLEGFKGGVIDLIEFTIPRNEEPPYARLNHLGMAKATVLTTNIEADYDYMKAVGVRFLAPPATRADGTAFAIFMDPDGTYYELSETPGDQEETETTHFTSLTQVNVNVSDFERSRAWYEMLGYELSTRMAPTDSPAVANAMGFDEAFQIDGAILTHVQDGSRLELVQWIKPFDPEPPYGIPVNHLGIHRMAFATTDIDKDVATLEAQGVEFLSEITPCCSGPDSSSSIVAFYDPDGVIVELVEQPPLMRAVFTILAWLAG